MNAINAKVSPKIPANLRSPPGAAVGGRLESVVLVKDAPM